MTLQALPPLHTIDQRSAEGHARNALEDCLTQEREETTIPINGTQQDARAWYQFIGKHATKWARDVLHDQTISADTNQNPDDDDWLTIDFSTGQIVELLTLDSLQRRKESDRRRERRFLIHIRIGSSTRAREAAAAVRQCITTITKDHDLAYTMPDATSFGMVLRTKMNAYQLRSAITRGRHEQTSPLTPGDDVLILELGTNHADQGMSRVTTWLLQHPSRH